MSHFEQNRSHENGRPGIASGPFGPAYDKQIDGPRLNLQHEKIRDWMLAQNGWKTLAEIHQALDYPEASVSAQMRHLRKPQYGSYWVQKRRRNSGKGTWEYRVLPPERPGTLPLFEELRARMRRHCERPRAV